MRLKVKVLNAELIRKGLQLLQRDLSVVAKKSIQKAAKRIEKREKIYPSRTSNYIRTFLFRGNWSVTEIFRGYSIKNVTSYAHYVVGHGTGSGQAWVHVPYWKPTFRQVADEEVLKLPKKIDAEIVLVSRKLGL